MDRRGSHHEISVDMGDCRAGVELAGAVIFVTAYDQYAVEAALPPSSATSKSPNSPGLTGNRCSVAGGPGADREPANLPESDRGAGDSGTSFVDTKDVDWLKAAENYVELHVGRDCYLVEVTMAEIAKRLDGGRFVRIHRSIIVNAERIRNVQSASHSEYLVTLASGIRLRFGRTYRETMQRLISNPF